MGGEKFNRFSILRNVIIVLYTYFLFIDLSSYDAMLQVLLVYVIFSVGYPELSCLDYDY